MEIKIFKQASLRRGLLLLVVFTAVLFFTVQPAFAGENCPAPGPGEYCCSNVDTLALTCLEGVFGNVLQGVLALVGILSFLFLIKGGIAYTMSGGDMKAVDSAKKTLTWAVIGLGFAIVAFAAMKLLSDTFDAKILRFVIPPPT